MQNSLLIRNLICYCSSVKMRTVFMSLSVLVSPRNGIRRLANFCWEGFHSLSGSHGNNSSFRLLCANNSSGLEGGYSRRWTRRPISTKTKGKTKTDLLSKPSTIVQEILEDKVLQSAALTVNKSEIIDTQNTPCCTIQQKILEKEDVASLVTVIVFDIETTGLRRDERVIEIALQDLAGGKNSTFQTLVNPGRHVPNSDIHGITTRMVCRPEVPRMDELIPILLQYISSRQKPGGYVMLVAHNGRTFDVPFLINEFSRCSFEIPPDWLFVDTMSLARELMKSGASNLPPNIKLQGLREHYNIPLAGSEHRAMSDVNSLSMVLQRLTFDLKLSIPDLVGKSFTALDCINKKKKTKKTST